MTTRSDLPKTTGLTLSVPGNGRKLSGSIYEEKEID